VTAVQFCFLVYLRCLNGDQAFERESSRSLISTAMANLDLYYYLGVPPIGPRAFDCLLSATHMEYHEAIRQLPPHRCVGGDVMTIFDP
jgi:hypothetical protein